MPRLILFLLILPFLSALEASELQLKTKFLPLYVQHGVIREGEEAIHAKPRSISFVSRGAEPETTLSFLNSPFIPAHDATWHEKGDSNLISLCGIKVSQVSKKLANGVSRLEIVLDLSAFQKPKHVSLSKAEVIDLVRDAITQNFGEIVIVIRKGEQAE